MNLLSQILACKTDEEAFELVRDAIQKSDANADQVSQLGFLNYRKDNHIHKGFIPLKTRIKYENIALETYGMETTDFFYEFTSFIRKNNINRIGPLIFSLEFFINNYFGRSGKTDRQNIFNTKAWQTTTTDEEYFATLEKNKIGDLKGMGAAECTERGALASQILSLFGLEVYYCMGCIELDSRQEGHCFNIVRRKNDYALLDYSVPVAAFNSRNEVRAYYPFVGEMSNEEFNDFVNNGTIKTFTSYEYSPDNKKEIYDPPRRYIVGKYEFAKEDTTSIHK